jgi:hypothetical protein
MSHEIILPAVRFPILSTDRYLNAEKAAKEAINKRIEEPKLDQFKATTSTHYPTWFTGSVMFALVCVLFFSFWVSSGKQAAASGLVFDHLPNKFSHSIVEISILVSAEI